MPTHPRRLLATVAAVGAIAVLAGCGSSDGSDASGDPGAGATTVVDDAGGATSVVGNAGDEPVVPPDIPVTPEGADGCRTAEDAQAETEAPDPAVPTEDATSVSVTDDIAGCGDLVEDTSTVEVQYVLKSKSSGEVVDSSWERGEPFEVGLGQGQVIPGWDLAIPGMRGGGRRTLVLGPDYAYGAQGNPPQIASGDTLVFVVDALTVS